MYVYRSIFHTFLELTGPSGYPLDLNVISADAISVIFSWSKVDCEKINGALLGYECKIFFHNFTHMERIAASITTCTYTITLPEFQTVPLAFSVAAINEAGVGDHCPQVALPILG